MPGAESINLDSILSAATMAIPQMYFHLSIEGGDRIYRERTYCYELYHQMRSLWPSDTRFYLNGEIDKASHPILAQLGADYAKPDLLVHQPGYMGGNYAIIEVKSVEASRRGIRGDLEKLSLFVRRVGYRRALYLIYGYSADGALARKIADIASHLDQLAAIELWLHYAVGEPAARHGWIEPRAGQPLARPCPRGDIDE